jgi:Glycosyltransferase family 20
VPTAQAQFRDQTVLIGVDDMDLFKGIELKLQAVERVLEQHADWRGKLVLVQVTNAPRCGPQQLLLFSCCTDPGQHWMHHHTAAAAVSVGTACMAQPFAVGDNASGDGLVTAVLLRSSGADITDLHNYCEKLVDDINRR